MSKDRGLRESGAAGGGGAVSPRFRRRSDVIKNKNKPRQQRNKQDEQASRAPARETSTYRRLTRADMATRVGFCQRGQSSREGPAGPELKI